MFRPEKPTQTSKVVMVFLQVIIVQVEFTESFYLSMIYFNFIVNSFQSKNFQNHDKQHFNFKPKPNVMATLQCNFIWTFPFLHWKVFFEIH